MTELHYGGNYDILEQQVVLGKYWTYSSSKKTNICIGKERRHNLGCGSEPFYEIRMGKHKEKPT